MSKNNAKVVNRKEEEICSLPVDKNIVSPRVTELTGKNLVYQNINFRN